MTDKFLGRRIRNDASGQEGICTSMSETMNGSRQYAIQPKVLDGESHKEGDYIDENLLSVIDEGLIDRLVTPAPNSINLGDEVEATVSRVRGIATQRLTWLNGCVFYTLSRPVNKDGVLPELHMFSAELLKVVKPVAEPAPIPEKRTGGPSTRTPRRMF